MFGRRGGECFFLHSLCRFREKRFLLQLLESRNIFADKVKACFITMYVLLQFHQLSIDLNSILQILNEKQQQTN